MKTRYSICVLVVLLGAQPLMAQQPSSKHLAPESDYTTDIATVGESQKEALEQARQMLVEAENPTLRAALQTAIKDMERADKSLQAAKQNAADLSSAVSAEQAAYQALLKLAPHEFQVNRSRRG